MAMKVIELLGSLAVFATLTCGVEIQCSYQNVYWADGVGSLYTCNATVTSVENPSTVTEIRGTHSEGSNNVDVKGFTIEGQKILTKIPKGIEKFFLNLQAFNWVSGNISTIDSSTLKPFPNILLIGLGGNNLVTIDGDLFQYTRWLRLIWININKLEHIGHDLLTGLSDLRYANFQLNSCIDVIASTSQQVQELNRQLPIKCPPLVTTPDPPTTIISTTPKPNDGRPITCTSNEEAVEMKNRMEEMTKRIEKLEKIADSICAGIATVDGRRRGWQTILSS